MNKFKTFAISVLAAVFALVLSANAFANAYDGSPYQNVGRYEQASRNIYYNYEVGFGQAYDYIAPPRAGGWFGSGTEWLVGLRSPMYSNVPPVHYSNYYTPVCGYPCYFGGGYGYPRARASDFPRYREPMRGIYGY